MATHKKIIKRLSLINPEQALGMTITTGEEGETCLTYTTSLTEANKANISFESR